MNESELRDGLRRTIATADQPPSMNTDAALEAARAAHRRRRTTVAGMGAAAAVVAIAVGGTVALSGVDRLDLTPGGQGPLTTPIATSPQEAGTETVWPTGADGQPQQDRTASNGERFEQGARLLTELIGVVPAGYTVPERTPILTTPDSTEVLTPDTDPWSRYNQSQFSDRVGGVEVWEHLASLAVSDGPNTGRLYVEVHTPGNTLPADTCGMAVGLWGLGGDCQVVSAGGQQIGVVANTSDRKEFDRWAAFRHADGTVVFVAQSTTFRGATAPLSRSLFTDEQLAELAVAERFHQVVTE